MEGCGGHLKLALIIGPVSRSILMNKLRGHPKKIAINSKRNTSAFQHLTEEDYETEIGDRCLLHRLQ